MISDDLTGLRGWFVADNHGSVIEGNFDLYRNEVKNATVEKIYKDERWKNTGKIHG